jgi:3-dehydroquinate synthase
MKPIISNGYSIYFDTELRELKPFLDQKKYSKVFFLTDYHTSKNCLPLIKKWLPELPKHYDIEVEPGEENKNIDYCVSIWNKLMDLNADRNSVLINLGGGVITDMGSFAAATYKRGIDFIQIPTTLLAQVDASAGGKTGVDLGKVKNIIGTFTQPKAVFISTGFLKTLDQRQLVSGFAEVVKHGLIYDADYFEQIKTIRPEDITAELIHRSVEIKNEVVTTDPFEKGLRKILNFGHTIGHAIESYFLTHDPNPLLHGEAIAIGMICEGYLSMAVNNLKQTELESFTGYIRSVFPDRSFDDAIYPEVIRIMKNDKKNSRDQIGFALLNKIGSCTYNIYIPENIIADSLDYYRKFIAS